MPRALLTNGFPLSPDFIDPKSVQKLPLPTSATVRQPFGYRFRVPPPVSGPPIMNPVYHPDLQIATVEGEIPMASGGGTKKGTTLYIKTYVDGYFVMDPARDTAWD